MERGIHGDPVEYGVIPSDVKMNMSHWSLVSWSTVSHATDIYQWAYG